MSKICVHSYLPCSKDEDCSKCELHTMILNDTQSKKELLKISNALHMPKTMPYVKMVAPDGRPALEIGIKGTF